LKNSDSVTQLRVSITCVPSAGVVVTLNVICPLLKRRVKLSFHVKRGSSQTKVFSNHCEGRVAESQARRYGNELRLKHSQTKRIA